MVYLTYNKPFAFNLEKSLLLVERRSHIYQNILEAG